MINDKIGFGIITCNRLEFFKKCVDSVPEVDELVIVNDGKPYPENVYPPNSYIIQHEKNKGIAKTKNDALKYLYDKGCEHIFLCEDDIIIKDKKVCQHYIKASKVSGIKHFNFAYAGCENKDNNGELKFRKKAMYDEIGISFNFDLSGAFSYYHFNTISSVGYMSEKYKNALEHVDHTYQIIKAGFHPPFKWFADVVDSYNFFEDQDNKCLKSVIRKPLLWKLKVYYNAIIFLKRNKHLPWKMPVISEKEVDIYLCTVKPNTSSV